MQTPDRSSAHLRPLGRRVPLASASRTPPRCAPHQCRRWRPTACYRRAPGRAARCWSGRVDDGQLDRIDLRDGVAVLVAHPDATRSNRHVVRSLPDGNHSRDAVALRIDPGQRPVGAVDDPRRAVAERDAGRPVAHRDRRGDLRAGLLIEPVDGPVALVRDPHRAAPAAIPAGSEPTGILATTRSVAMSIFDTEAFSVFATQTALPVATSALGPAPTRTGDPTTSSFSGLTRETVPSPLLATQIEPSGATVTATGSLPTGICVISMGLRVDSRKSPGGGARDPDRAVAPDGHARWRGSYRHG